MTQTPTGLPALEFLQQGEQWVCYDAQKTPISPVTLTGVSGALVAGNPNWTNYETACGVWKANSSWLKGVGREFIKSQGLTGIDLDDCIDDHGIIAPYAGDIITLFDSYTELSPGLRGVHIWVQGSIPKAITSEAFVDCVEAYDEKRYFTITGKPYPSTPTMIVARPQALDAFYKNVMDTRHKKAKWVAELRAKIKECGSATEGTRNAALCKLGFRAGALIKQHNLVESAIIAAILKECKHWENPEKTRTTLLSAISAGNKTTSEEPGREKFRGYSKKDQMVKLVVSGHAVSNGNNTDHKPAPEAVEKLPEFIIQGQLRDQEKLAMEVLTNANKAHPRLFLYLTTLAQVAKDENGAPYTLQLDRSAIRHELSCAADFLSWKKVDGEMQLVDAHPPASLADQLLSMPPHTWKLPPLRAIVQAPVLRPDGTILDQPGYDAATRLYYVPSPDMKRCIIPANPTKLDAMAAEVYLRPIFANFPFEGEADRANAYAALFTALVRFSVKKDVQLGLIDATNPGTGKGLLCTIISITATGAKPDMFPAKNDEDEWRKAILSILLTSPRMIVIDNIRGVLQSAALELVLTAEGFNERILGQSKTAKPKNEATWLATGNNLLVGGDLPRRCYRIRLVATEANPDERPDSAFEIPNLEDWISDNRPEVVAAILTIARAWYLAGKPLDPNVPNMGTFSDWAKTIGGMLAFVGIHGFQQNRGELRSRNSEEAAEWEAFLSTWYEMYWSEWKTASEILTEVKKGLPQWDSENKCFFEPPANMLYNSLPAWLRKALVDKPNSFDVTLGIQLGKRVQTKYGTAAYSIEKDWDKHEKKKLWRVVRVVAGGSSTQASEEKNKNSPRPVDETAESGSSGENHPQPPAGAIDEKRENLSTRSTPIVQEQSVFVEVEEVAGGCDFPCLKCGEPAIEVDEVGDGFCAACFARQPVVGPVGIRKIAANLETGCSYVVDLETTGLNPRESKVVSIALGSVGSVSIIDTRRYYALSEDEKQVWREALHSLFATEGVTWVGHNIKFDWAFLSVHFGVELARVYDTMLSEKLLHNNGEERIAVSLQATAQRYDLHVEKEERNWFIDLDTRAQEWGAPFPDMQLNYMKQDIEIPSTIYDTQEASISAAGLARVVSLENQALPAIAALEVHGVKVDVERWQAILGVKQYRQKELAEHIQAVLGDAITAAQEVAQNDLDDAPVRTRVKMSSTKQLKEGLQALGIEVASIKNELLEEVKDDHPIVSEMIEWGKIKKFVSSFGDKLLDRVEKDGRIHANFDQLGAVSGRIICSKPNLQQIPRPDEDADDLRANFIAPLGHKLLVSDLSNIELRILADVSQDKTMLRLFSEGKDLHSETAKLMFNLPPETDTKKHLINGASARQIAKTINFGLAYGMGATGLALRIGVDKDTATTLMSTYFRTYKGVDAYLKKAGSQGVTQGYTTSLSGRRRNFSQATLEDPARCGAAERASKNHGIQGCNADILKAALAQLRLRLPGGVHIIMTIHDELVLECPDDLVVQATGILQACMVDACREFLKVVAIPEPEVLVSTYWVKG